MIYYFQMYQDARKEWRWTFIAPNGRKMADSGEGYQTRTACEQAINTLKAQAPTAPIRG